MASEPGESEPELGKDPSGSLEDRTVGVVGAMIAFTVVLLVGAVIVGVAFGPSEAERSARAEARSQNLSDAEVTRLWTVHCASCHGPRGRGLTAPDATGVSQRLSVEEHARVLSKGRNSMPAFEGRLLDAEIDALVTYQREVLDNR